MRYARDLHRFALRCGVRTADAPDVVQLAAIAAWRFWESCELPVEQRGPWLFAIVVRVAWRFQRRTERPQVDLRDPREIDHEADTAPLADEAIEVRESVATLGELEAGTTPERWRAFVLYEIEGVPAVVIAKREIVPLGTVYTRLRLARRDVRAVVQRHRAKLVHDDAGGEGTKAKPTK